MQISVILFLESLGGGELILILLFVLMFFGSKNIPSLARGLGKGIREVKDAMSGVQNEINKGMYEVEKHTNVLKDGINEPLKDIEKSIEDSVEDKIEKTETPEITEKPISESPTIQPEERSAAR